MKSLGQTILHKGQIYLTIILGTLPLPLAMLAYLNNQLLPYFWFFPALYLVFCMISLMVPGKVRLFYGAVAVLLLLLPGALLPEEVIGTRETVLMIGLIYGILLLLSLQVAGWNREQELPINVCGYCLIPHCVGQFLAMMDQRSGEIMATITPWMSGALIVFAGLVMLAMNRNSMAQVTGKRKSIAVAIRQKNTMLTMALFFVAVVTALVPSIFGSILNSFIVVGEWIAKLQEMLDFAPDIPITVPTEGTVVTEPPFYGNEEYDPVVGQRVFVVVGIIATAILLPLVILAVIRVLKALRKAYGSFWKWLQLTAYNAQEDSYEDEVTDIRSDPEWEKMKRERKQRRKALFVFEQRLTPTERIRYQYRRLSEKHKDWIAASTARENLPADAAAVYERARYSNHPISDEDAVQFKAKTRKLS